jgi:hypothetical protein
VSEKDGDKLFNIEDYDGAMKKFRAELKKPGTKPRDQVRKARLRRKIGNCYRRKGQFIPSLNEYDSGLNVIANARATKNIKMERARLHYEKGLCYFFSNPMDLAKHFTEIGRELLLPYDAKLDDAAIQSSLGDVYHFLAILEREQGDPVQFFENIEKARRRFDFAGDKKGSLECEFDSNVERLISGNFQEPIDFFTGKLTEIRKLIPNRLSFAYLNLALAYADADELTSAKENANRSLDAANESQDPIGQQRAYEVLAEISMNEAKQAISANKNDEAQKYAYEVRKLVDTGMGVAHNLQGSEYQEFEYNGKLINAEVNIIVGDLDRADELLVDALFFSDVNNLNLSLNSRAEIDRIRALLNTAYAERSKVVEEQGRYRKNAIRDLERARSILKKYRLNGKLIRVDIETAKLERLLLNFDKALKILDSALDKAQQYNRYNDVETIYRLFIQYKDIEYEESSKEDIEQLQIFRSFLVRLCDVLVAGFDVEELRTLCFKLGINHDEFPSTRSNMARELVLMMNRRNRLCELYCCAREERPNADWPIMPNCDCENKPSCKDQQQASKPQNGQF